MGEAEARPAFSKASTRPVTAPVRTPSTSGEQTVKTQPLEIRQLPDQLTTSLQHIVRQMDILTQTMSILEVFLFWNQKLFERNNNKKIIQE